MRGGGRSIHISISRRALGVLRNFNKKKKPRKPQKKLDGEFYGCFGLGEHLG